ncbi:hypothetical protein D3C86_1675130 [compost metagenome]
MDLQPSAWRPSLMSLAVVDLAHPASPIFQQNEPNPAQAASDISTLMTLWAVEMRRPISERRQSSHCCLVMVVVDFTPAVLPSHTVQTLAPSM